MDVREPEGATAWVLDGQQSQQEVHDSYLTEACRSDACDALKGVDWAYYWRTDNNLWAQALIYADDT